MSGSSTKHLGMFGVGIVGNPSGGGVIAGGSGGVGISAKDEERYLRQKELYGLHEKRRTAVKKFWVALWVLVGLLTLSATITGYYYCGPIVAGAIAITIAILVLGYTAFDVYKAQRAINVAEVANKLLS